MNSAECAIRCCNGGVHRRGEDPATMRTSSLQHRHRTPWLRFAAGQRRSSVAMSCAQPAGVKPGTISNLAASSPCRDPSTGEKATVTAA
jgi:hypothetical protein